MGAVLLRATYSENGDLVDEEGSTWQRVVDWLEPDEAAARFAMGLPYLVERTQAAPVRGTRARFERDILGAMVTHSEADRLSRHRVVSTVMVGELWRSPSRGDCLVFVEQES